MPTKSTKLYPCATIAIIAGLMLTGCAATPSTDTDASTGDVSATPSAPEEQIMPDTRQVDVVEVIDPTTVVVTPTDEADSLYGTDFTVTVAEISTAAEGACGYDETLTLAEETLLSHPWTLWYDRVTDGVYIDDQGVHHAYFNTSATPYGLAMVSAGYAYLPSGQETGSLSTYLDDARNAGTGLWASCPGFGA